MNTGQPSGIAKIIRLEPNLELSKFSSGDPIIDDYARYDAHLEHAAFAADVFVALTAEDVASAFISLKPVNVHSSLVGANSQLSFLELAYLGVERDWQRQGVGTQMLLKAIDIFTKSSADGLVINVIGGKQWLFDWYQLYGFEKVKGSDKLILLNERVDG